MNARPTDMPETLDEASPKPAEQLTREELAELFDRNARYYFAMTGDEFRLRWHASEISPPEDASQHEAVDTMTLLLPLVEREATPPGVVWELVERAHGAMSRTHP